MKRYVLGFLFSTDQQRVALIQKTKPEWQAGKLNGLGGSIESGEIPQVAMKREFQEEAGLDIWPWIPYVIVYGIDYDMQVFKAFDDKLSILQDDPYHSNEGTVRVYDINYLPFYVLPNLRWLIPMALDSNMRYTQHISY